MILHRIISGLLSGTNYIGVLFPRGHTAGSMRYGRASGRLFRISDRYYKENPVSELASSGAEIIIVISASSFCAGKNRIRTALISLIAKKYNAEIIYVNQAGANDSLIFDGLSTVCDRMGNIKVLASEFVEDIVLCDMNSIENDNSSIPSDIFPSEEESVLKALIIGTKDYIRKCGFSKAVIGLSGGIDSALTAAIAVKALGNENVSGVFMPSTYTSRQNYIDTRVLAENLNIKLKTVPIDSMYKEFKRALPFSEPEIPGITEQNIQARIRGTILMAFSNKTGALVLATGNKSELAAGYCTLYGDMCGGLAVIGDILKMTVYKLAVLINKDKQIIPANILLKAPSAELAPGQKDQDDLPPYEILDPILKGYIEEGKDIAELTAEGFDKKLVTGIISRIIKNEYKREQAPPELKITSKAFWILE